MRILLTGATGYLGSQLAIRLLAEGHQVSALKRSQSSLNRLHGHKAAISFYDLDQDNWARIWHDPPVVDVVIHTATCYGRNGESLDQLLIANVLFPLRLLKQAAAAGVKRFVNTDTCLAPAVSPYALSKRHFLEWARLVKPQEHLCFVNAVLEHFYGPDDDETKFTSQLLRQCLTHVPEIPLSSGEQRRDFIHVADVVSALLRLALEPQPPETRWKPYSVGSGQAVSIREFAQLVHRLTGSRSRLNFGALPLRENECMFSQANPAELRRLGWEPQFDLQTGLQNTIEAMRLQSRQ